MNEFNEIRDAYQQNMFARNGNFIDTLALYSALADKNITGDQQEGLYHLAARFADIKGIEFLKNAGIEPGTDKYGNTPLHALTTTKFDYNGPDVDTKADHIYKAAQLFLSLNINPKKKNDSGKVAYYEAGIGYLYPFIRAMADAGVKMDFVAGEGKNVLHAICDGLVHRKSITGAEDAAFKTVKALLAKDSVDPEDKDIFETTPLTYAQRSGVKTIAALLSGDETDTVTGGMTLHEAVLNQDTAAVKRLIELGVDLNEMSDKYRRTPLMLACEYASGPMVTLLAGGGSDVNYKSGDESTAVYYLITKAVSNFGRGMSKDTKDILLMLRTLIKHNLNVDAAIDAEGNTALSLVCQAGYLADLNTSLAEELIAAGSNINRPNNDGKTPLMLFAARGDEMKYNIAELLIDNKADTAYTDKSGQTALMYAAGSSDKMSAKKMVSLILDNDKSTAPKVNNNGETAMDIAVRTANEAVVKQLLNAI